VPQRTTARDTIEAVPAGCPGPLTNPAVRVSRPIGPTSPPHASSTGDGPQSVSTLPHVPR
jgi:hypothetical protein